METQQRKFTWRKTSISMLRARRRGENEGEGGKSLIIPNSFSCRNFFPLCPRPRYRAAPERTLKLWNASSASPDRSIRCQSNDGLNKFRSRPRSRSIHFNMLIKFLGIVAVFKCRICDSDRERTLTCCSSTLSRVFVASASQGREPERGNHNRRGRKYKKSRNRFNDAPSVPVIGSRYSVRINRRMNRIGIV
jgi:hypothetical protein